MKVKAATWFVCKVSYEKTMDNGLQKTVTETYVVDALSFTEAEARIIEEMSAYGHAVVEVESISKAPFSNVFFMTEDNNDTCFYKAKLAFITIDEKTEKEKRSNVVYLVEGTSLHNALHNIDDVMNDTMMDYVQVNVQETPVIDVLLHQNNPNPSTH